MNNNSRYMYLVLAYVVVFLYVALVNDSVVTGLMVLGLLVLSLTMMSNIKSMLEQDKEESVLSLKTKLTKTERKSEESYKRFLSLSQTLGSGVFMVDEEGIISFSNKDVENYFEMDLNGKDYNELASIKPLYHFVNTSFLTEERVNEQIKLDENVYDLISTPIFEKDLFVGSLIVVHDITNLKTAQKLQKRFTADVSHELKTPLSAIKGFSEIMLRDEKMSEENRREFVELINTEANRMEIILNDLMIISKLDRLDYELELNEEDIKDVINETANSYKQAVKNKGLELRVEAESCVMAYDKLRIHQLLSNLLRNALNYTDEGSIGIHGYVEEENYIIKVSDTGIGISQKNQERIFTRFYRVDKARSRDTGGSGLGLSISKHVVLKHGGSLSVESEENVGSTFIISLPMKR